MTKYNDSNASNFDRVEAVLDEALKMLSAGNVLGFGNLMLDSLNNARRLFDPGVWSRVIVPYARLHPVYPLALQCPFSRRSTVKPRGYAGDAVLLDFLYRAETVKETLSRATDMGRQITEYWAATPAAAAVRRRCELLGEMIEGTAEHRDNPSLPAMESEREGW